MKHLLISTFLLLTSATIWAQPLQIIRGQVTDKETKMPLVGATVVLLHSDPIKGTMTDKDGNFRLEKVALGRQGVKVTYMGYKPALFQDIILNSVKEAILDVELEESVIVGAETVSYTHLTLPTKRIV